MPANLDLTGVSQLMRTLRLLETDLAQALGAALYQHAQTVMTRARELTPVRNRGGGTLRASGTVLPPEIVGQTITVQLGFGGAAARYAASVHSNVRSGHTGGVSPSGRKYTSWAETGQWKFLETAVDEGAAMLVSDLAATVTQVLRRHAGR